MSNKQIANYNPNNNNKSWISLLGYLEYLYRLRKEIVFCLIHADKHKNNFPFQLCRTVVLFKWSINQIIVLLHVNVCVYVCVYDMVKE